MNAITDDWRDRCCAARSRLAQLFLGDVDWPANVIGCGGDAADGAQARVREPVTSPFEITTSGWSDCLPRLVANSVAPTLPLETGAALKAQYGDAAVRRAALAALFANVVQGWEGAVASREVVRESRSLLTGATCDFAGHEVLIAAADVRNIERAGGGRVFGLPLVTPTVAHRRYVGAGPTRNDDAVAARRAVLIAAIAATEPTPYLPAAGHAPPQALSPARLVSPAEESLMARLAADGVASATPPMIESCLQLVRSLVDDLPRSAFAPAVDADDLVQEGFIGLMRAVETFDVSLGWSLALHVRWRTRLAMLRAVDDQANTIRIPVHIHDRLRVVSRLQRALPPGETITPATCADVFGISDREAERLGALPSAHSIDDGMELGRRPADLVPDPRPSPADLAEAVDGERGVARLLLHCNPRARMIVVHRLGLFDAEEATLEALADQFGVTRERVRQLEREALRTLRVSGAFRPDPSRDVSRARMRAVAASSSMTRRAAELRRAA